MVKQDGGEERRDVRTPVDLQVLYEFSKKEAKVSLTNYFF
jgi:hypothetical protein